MSVCELEWIRGGSEGGEQAPGEEDNEISIDGLAW